MLTHTILIVFAIWSLVPVVWTVLTSFKPESKIFTTQIKLIDDPTLKNYTDLLTRGDFVSLGVQLAVRGDRDHDLRGLPRGDLRLRDLALPLPWPELGALHLPRRPDVPGASSCSSRCIGIFTNLGLIDTPWSLILSYSTFAIPFCILMLKGFFDTIPYELEEAGRVDGLGVFGTFWRIVIPLSVPGLAVTAFFGFVTAWNEFLFAKCVPDRARTGLTLPVGMATFIDPFNQPWGLLTAGSVLITVPVMIFFFVAQRYLISGLSTGGVKG